MKRTKSEVCTLHLHSCFLFSSTHFVIGPPQSPGKSSTCWWCQAWYPENLQYPRRVVLCAQVCGTSVCGCDFWKSSSVFMIIQHTGWLLSDYHSDADDSDNDDSQKVQDIYLVHKPLADCQLYALPFMLHVRFKRKWTFSSLHIKLKR